MKIFQALSAGLLSVKLSSRARMNSICLPPQQRRKLVEECFQRLPKMSVGSGARISRGRDSHESVSLPDRSNVGESSCSASSLHAVFKCKKHAKHSAGPWSPLKPANGLSHAHNTTMTDARTRV